MSDKVNFGMRVLGLLGYHGNTKVMLLYNTMLGIDS